MKKTVAFARNATNIFFHILTACNLKCRHCYINRSQHGKKTLSIETIESWLAAFAKRSSEANVIFLGGEPTLHLDLPRAIRTARTIGYQSITVDTNGYLFHDFLSKVSPSEIDYLSFSLDGATPETNDFIRGEGCFDTCVAHIEKAVSQGFRASLIFTVSRLNISELDKMRPLLLKLGVERFFIQVIGIRGNPALAPHGEQGHPLQLTRTEWETIIPTAAEAAAQEGIIVTYPKVFLDLHEPFECAGRVADNCFIFPNGRVYRCPLCEDFPLHSLTLSDGRLTSTEKINESDLFNLDIPEGCVMNRLIQPDNIQYETPGKPRYKIACCLLKETLLPDTGVCPG